MVVRVYHGCSICVRWRCKEHKGEAERRTKLKGEAERRTEHKGEAEAQGAQGGRWSGEQSSRGRLEDRRCHGRLPYIRVRG